MVCYGTQFNEDPRILEKQRRGIVVYLQSAYRMSQRKACRLARLSRKAVAYQPLPRNGGALKQRLKEPDEQYPQ